MCTSEGLDVPDLADPVAGLLDKSVLVREQTGAGAWYRLPRLLRDYARRHLLNPDEWAQLRERHAQWCLTLAERAAPALFTATADRWTDRLADSHASLRAAHAWWTEPGGDTTSALRLARLLRFYWILTGRVGEGRAWLDRALQGPVQLRRPRLPPVLRVRERRRGPERHPLAGLARHLALRPAQRYGAGRGWLSARTA